MISNHFRLKIVLRLITISISLGVFLYYVFVTGQYLRSAYFFVFACLIVIELFWFIDRTNRRVSNFFDAILQADFTTTFPKDQPGLSFGRLYGKLNRITEKFREIGSEKEAQYHFLESILQQVSVGVISFDHDEKVSIANDSFKKLTGIPHLTELKSVNKLSPDLYHSLKEIKSEEKKLKKLQFRGQLIHLSIQASLIRIREKEFKLVTVQNIKSELESGEVEAWQKLIRVLAHEILNSITPITSLTDTMLEIFESKEASNDTLINLSSKNIYTGLKTIKNRSEALNRFTQAYQNLTRIPKPEFSKIYGSEFIENINSLFKSEMKKKKIEWNYSINPKDHEFIGDKELLGQVVINLVKNSIDSLNEKYKAEALITLKLRKEGENTIITVEDNGAGIPLDKMDEIFVPFFTTRKNGSGIGLALARQIIRMHNGIITVDSSPGKHTFFNIKV